MPIFEQPPLDDTIALKDHNLHYSFLLSSFLVDVQTQNQQLKHAHYIFLKVNKIVLVNISSFMKFLLSFKA